jgi:hypothetical protein
MREGEWRGVTEELVKDREGQRHHGRLRTTCGYVIVFTLETVDSQRGQSSASADREEHGTCEMKGREGGV